MANFTTNADLVNSTLFAAGEPTNGTSDFDARALELLNRAYRALWTGGNEYAPEVNEVWWWLKASTPQTLTLDPAIDSLTATVSNNSTSVTMSAAPSPTVDSDVEGWFFRVDGHPDTFRVSNQAGAALTLDSVYTGADGSAKACKLFKLEYTLASGILAVIAPMRAYQDSRMEVGGMEEDQLDRNWPIYAASGGVPRNFAVVNEASGLLKIRFSHYGGTSSTDLIRLDYPYLQLPSDLADDSNECLVSKNYRYILADMAAHDLLLEKNDSRAPTYAQKAAAGIRAMAKENRRKWALFSRIEAKIMPRIGDLPRNRELLRTESGLILG